MLSYFWINAAFWFWFQLSTSWTVSRMACCILGMPTSNSMQFDLDIYIYMEISCYPLQWRHNEHDGVSNHQPYDCLLNHLFKHRSKKTPKLRVTGLGEGNSPVTGEFPAQRASNAGKVSTWWCHHRYWWCMVHGSLSSMRKQCIYLRHVSFEKL